MIFEQIEIGGDRNFAYLVGDPVTRRAAIVDPGVNPARALERVEALGLELVYVINTHGHSDHIAGNGKGLFQKLEVLNVEGMVMKLFERPRRSMYKAATERGQGE